AQRLSQAARHGDRAHRAAHRYRQPRSKGHQRPCRDMDRRTAEGPLLIRLGGRWIEYRFARRRRRSIGISVDANGLAVSAPLRAPWRDIEAFLLQKARWIVRKLEAWARGPRPPSRPGKSGEFLLLVGRA